MKFTQIPQDTFKKLVLNAGVLLSAFNPATAEYDNDDIIGATSDDVTFVATPSYSDFGADINNCPKNTKELKRLDGWVVKISGVWASMDATNAKSMVGAADEAGGKITPRNDIADTDFKDIWLVADYSDKNGTTNGGYMAIHMMNGLSTGGFQLKTGDRSKGKSTFEITGHYSITAQDTPPFEIYVKAGEAESATM